MSNIKGFHQKAVRDHSKLSGPGNSNSEKITSLPPPANRQRRNGIHAGLGSEARVRFSAAEKKEDGIPDTNRVTACSTARPRKGMVRHECVFL